MAGFNFSSGTGGFSLTNPTTSSGGFSFNPPATSSGSFAFAPPSTVPTTITQPTFGQTLGGASSFGLNLQSTSSGTLTSPAPSQFSLSSTTTSAPGSATQGSLGFTSFGSTSAATTTSGFSLTSVTPSSSGLGGGFSLSTTATSQPSLGSFSLGSLPPSTAPVAIQTSIPPPFNFSSSQPTTTAFNLNPPPSTAATTPFSFSNTPAPTAVSTAAPSSSTFGFTAGPSTGLGLKSNAAPISLGTSSPSTGLSFNFPTSTSTSSGTSSLLPGISSSAPQTSATLSTATTTSTALTSGSGLPSQPTLSVRGLEEKLNKWLVELKEQEERFLKQANHVNAWDQVLQNGHVQVQALKDTLHTVKSDQSRLEAELDFIRGQQDELEHLLEPLEAAISSTPTGQLHQGDRQRDNMYDLAQNLDTQLRQMTDELCKVIEHLNTSGAPQQSDPVNLVARILSAHMDTLKWVDQNAILLTQKMEDLSHLAVDTM